MKNSKLSRRYFISVATLAGLSAAARAMPVLGPVYASVPSFWEMAKLTKEILKLSVWVLAQDVQRLLATPDGVDKFISWCKLQGGTKVYLEAYGRGLYVDRTILETVKKRCLQEGLEIQGGIQTVNGPDNFDAPHCFTSQVDQDELQKIFEYTASIFDEIIIDDWFFTNCQNAESVQDRGQRSWAEYYSDVMVKMSKERVMLPSHKVNPKVKVIIKYPQWNEMLQSRGYDVVRESVTFDGIWAGTEAREFDFNSSAGYESSYNAYFNMRWLAGFGKVGGGWFDIGGDRTKVNTYLEQARHTVLGEAREMILCFYTDTFPADKFDGLRKDLPGLIKLAKLIKDKPVKGVPLVKPGNSDAFEEEYVCSFMGSLGIPFVPSIKVNEQAASAFFSVHVVKDKDFTEKLSRILKKGTPVVVTDGLAKRLKDYPDLLQQVTVLPLNGSPRTLLTLSAKQIKPFRDKLMAPLEMRFHAPAKVELYLFGNDTVVIVNTNDQEVEVTLDLAKVSSVKRSLVLPEDSGTADVTLNGKRVKAMISARALTVIIYS
ncbi:MAG: hypothetical protein V4594_12005 [Bacteroidota bacterium]